MNSSLRLPLAIAALIAGPALAAAASPAPTAANPLSDGHDDSVTICHSLDASKGYELLRVSSSGALAGHAAQHPQDIIPPFTYYVSTRSSSDDGDDDDERGRRVFPGQNWGAEGQAIWHSDCAGPIPAPLVVPSSPTPRMPDSQPFVPLTATSSGADRVVAQLVTAVYVCRIAGDVYSPVTLTPDALIAGLSTHVGDIVPPFMYLAEDGLHAFPGFNWNAGGQQTWGSGCKGMRTLANAQPGEAVLRLTISAARRRPAVGTRVAFRVTARAIGPASATAPRLCVTIPRSLSIVSAPKARVRGRAACWSTGISSAGTTRRTVTVLVKKGMGGAMIHANGLFTARNAVSYRALGTITPPRPVA